MSRFSVLSALVVIVPVLSGVTGCARDDDEEAASATATSALQASNQYGVTDAIIDDEAPEAPEPEVVAQRIVERETRGLSPAGCAKKTREGSVVTIGLKGCTGPLGRVVMDGTLRVTLSRTTEDLLHAELAGDDDLTANGKPLHYTAGADIRYEGTRRFVTYHGASRGETKRGRSFERQTDLSIVADSATHCAAIDGTSKGSVAGITLDVNIEGFEGCRDACPTAGLARAVVRGPRREVSIDVSFDGSDEASVTTSRGKDFKVALACGDAEAAE